MPDFGGNTPHIAYGVQTDYKRLYYSEPTAALKVPITCQAGYGALEQGMAMALNLSAAGNVNKCVPYNPTTFPAQAASMHPGRAMLVADAGSGVNECTVSVADSYKFVVGDDLIINDDNTTAENLGAITAIDHDTGVIQFTTATTGAFGTTNNAYVAVEAGDSSNNFSDCVGILESALDTGTGADAKGANGVLVISNATLYAGLLTNVDAAAITDLAATSFGQFLVVK